jgi:hypothetical protein
MNSERFSPEKYGFDNSRRSWGMILAIQNQTNTWVYNDSRNNQIQKYVDFFLPRQDIIVLDLPDHSNHLKLANSLQIPFNGYSYDHQPLATRKPYLILRHLDQLILKQPNSGDMYQVLCLAQKYSGGTMYTVSNERKTNEQYLEMKKLAQTNWWLEQMLDDFSVTSIIT